ncbi:putative polysaccharide biosynthesis protein [Alkalibaculum sporogenes]|uniref:putative polysaccharide biosynthesis protein n=1 Tax=Alkalibaculum sporogenes TaxID=2655001 RepID=UPI00187B6AB8|nr:polysaccharide biosynthesis protein [Alkalibaculum sporogenes]
MSSYIKGAGIIATGGIIAKLLGLFFKVPIGRILGDFGFGLYYNSYNIYNLLLTVSIVGVPVAISKMISERASVKNYYGLYSVFKLSMTVLLLIGGISSAVLYFGAHWIIDIANWHPDTYYAIIGLSAAPFFVSIMCAIRGFFQGMQMMTPSAISQIIESIVRVIFGIGLCLYLTQSYGLAMGAGGASAGATIGAILTTLFLLFALSLFMKSFRKNINESKKIFKKESNRAILKRLTQIAVPVTLASAVVSLFGIINSFTYVPRLQVAGFNIDTATSMFGDFGRAQTMINVPLTFSAAMVITLVPAISASFALNDIKSIRRKTELGIRVMLLISLPCAVGLSIYADPIFELLFPASQYGGEILKYLSYSTVFIMITNTLQSVLQGLDKFMVPVKNLFIGLIVKFILNYIFIAIPSINIYGLVISNIGAYAVSTLLNYISIKKCLKIKLNINQTVVKPLTASLIMAIVGMKIFNVVSTTTGENIGVLISITLCVVVYFVALILLKGLTREELLLLPGGRKIIGMFKK